ncbi:hypothetical protein GON26_04875 [Flavobacterium sp. GA093]|uniref:Transposase IS200-like domain-containing protein n=1 Tax=Flavobacterium hydrocarbonoxydans TaxID=2683249 RepID=A0A6I4NLC1_9FLAO|nr:transposase [Flavobacterium hydrocarbonoxydans]MWB93682.1 hypothetical protein [Flavobacterium hydrocarbonoxydans]
MKYNPTIHKRRSIRLKGYDYSQAGLYFITICCDARIYRFGDIEDGEMILNEFGKIAYEEWSKLADRFPNFDLDVFQIMPNHIHGIIVLSVEPIATNISNTVEATLAVAPPQEDNPITEKATIESWAGASHAPTNQTNVRASLADAPRKDNPPIIKETPIRAGASPAPTEQTENKRPTISDIVGAYKSIVANRCLEIYKSRNKIMGRLWQRNYYEHIIRDERAYHNISNYIINNPKKWQEDKFHKQK